jgi:hypothetical protein
MSAHVANWIGTVSNRALTVVANAFALYATDNDRCECSTGAVVKVGVGWVGGKIEHMNASACAQQTSLGFAGVGEAHEEKCARGVGSCRVAVAAGRAERGGWGGGGGAGTAIVTRCHDRPKRARRKPLRDVKPGVVAGSARVERITTRRRSRE